MTQVAAIDTASDELTDACRTFREAVAYPDLEASGAEVRRVIGDAATRTALLAAAATADLVTISAHGLPSKLLARVGLLLESGHYPANAVTGKIFHCLACESGAELGPDLVRNGCRAFFGYREPFLFPIDRPADFLECDAEIAKTLCAGGNADDAYRLAIKKFNRKIAELKAAGKAYRASMLQQNRNALCCPSVDGRWGDPAASL